MTPNSITVHWEEVDCLDRNGAITGYVARALSNGREKGTASVGGDDREATISGLTPSTQYIVQVAAVNSAGTGPYSPIALYGTEGIAQYYYSRNAIAVVGAKNTCEKRRARLRVTTPSNA